MEAFLLWKRRWRDLLQSSWKRFPLTFGNLSVFLHEIEELLRPEIYGLMERFLDQKFEKGQLCGI